jgi:xylulose-5-phosphate/fructose-6-phosphate phosphoketolase
LLLRDLRLPDFRDYAVEVTAPGAVTAESTRVMGRFLRDVMKMNSEARNFRLFSPDENNSNRWQDVLEVTNRAWVAETLPWDDHLAPDGRVKGGVSWGCSTPPLRGNSLCKRRQTSRL